MGEKGRDRENDGEEASRERERTDWTRPESIALHDNRQEGVGASEEVIEEENMGNRSFLIKLLMTFFVDENHF